MSDVPKTDSALITGLLKENRMLRQGLPICACGDSFTSEALCCNCLAGMSFAPSDAQINAVIREFTVDTSIHGTLKEFAVLLLVRSK